VRKAFLKKARAMLEDMRAQTVRSVQHDLSEGREHQKDDGMDTYDLASDARDQEISVILVSSQLQSEAGARRLQAEAIREQIWELGLIGAEYREIGERLDEVIQQFGTLEQARAYADARALANVQSLLIESLRELDFEIRRQLTPDASRGQVTAGSGAVPEEYREMVEEYFRSLARP
jgi:hypothetical protein